MPDVHASFLWFPDTLADRSGRLKRLIAEGKPIPEMLLPGRAFMAMSPSHRADLAKTDFSNVAPWWIKIVCG